MLFTLLSCQKFDMIPNRNEEKTMTTLNAQKMTGVEVKATKANVKTAKLQNVKADALLEKVNAKAPATSKAPEKPQTNIDGHQNIISHVKSSDFITAEYIRLTNQYINSGKNALLFKAFLESKKNTKVELLTQLGYDFKNVLDTSACSASQLKNKIAKLEKAILKDYLHKLATMFASFVKEPTTKKLESIQKYDSDNSGIVKAILEDGIKDIIFSDALTFTEKMKALPAFLTVNYEEEITPKLPKSKNPNEPNPPLKTTAPTVATENFNAIKDYILNDADNATLELMQALIAQKLQPTENV